MRLHIAAGQDNGMLVKRMIWKMGTEVNGNGSSLESMKVGSWEREVAGSRSRSRR